jgi:hypothetical protein
MFKLVVEALRVIAELLGLINRRTDLKNAADVKAAQKSQNEVTEISKTEQAVKNKDLKQAQNDWAE